MARGGSGVGHKAKSILAVIVLLVVLVLGWTVASTFLAALGPGTTNDTIKTVAGFVIIIVGLALAITTFEVL